jgi:hypothetical protein
VSLFAVLARIEHIDDESLACGPEGRFRAASHICGFARPAA